MSRAEICWPQPPRDWLLTPTPLPDGPSAAPVHVWADVLTAAPEVLAARAATLSAAERDRAGRLRREQDRDRFIAGRGLLREILGRYLQADPRGLEFAYGPQGKPSLAGSFAGSGWHFNLAHSQDLALLAITRAGPVGVDVEQVRLPDDVDELVSRFFSPGESAAFRELAGRQKAAAFFNLWTRKEAWLKATGEGIGALLNRVEVSFLPGEPARLLSLPFGPGGTPWALQDLAPAPGFTAALAVATRNALVQCWRYT
jgi:4'-phosphopantetheinyl transferase